MKQSSRRKKGQLLQNLVRDKILKNFKHLKKTDVGVPSVGANGPDIVLSKVAQKLIEHTFETKNQEKMKTIYQWYAQTVRNTKKGSGVLVIKMNGRKPLVVIDLDHFFTLIKT